LCNFLDQACAVSFDGLNILELGCGAALPSILTLIKGANSVTLQDFVSFSFHLKKPEAIKPNSQNDFVLEAFTKRNFQLNNQMDPSKCTFIAAEWSKLMDEIGPKIKFDLILTSETIYNEANYLQLVETMDSLLAPHGKM
jgi:predicted nicotinamide N-methyase